MALTDDDTMTPSTATPTESEYAAVAKIGSGKVYRCGHAGVDYKVKKFIDMHMVKRLAMKGWLFDPDFWEKREHCAIYGRRLALSAHGRDALKRYEK